MGTSVTMLRKHYAKIITVDRPNFAKLITALLQGQAEQMEQTKVLEAEN